MAGHPVAASLLMLALLIGGFVSAMRVKQEVFPEFSLDVIGISVPYPGAGPEEVETGIILSVEDSVRGIEGVKRVTSTARLMLLWAQRSIRCMSCTKVCFIPSTSRLF